MLPRSWVCEFEFGTPFTVIDPPDISMSIDVAPAKLFDKSLLPCDVKEPDTTTCEVWPAPIVTDDDRLTVPKVTWSLPFITVPPILLIFASWLLLLVMVKVRVIFPVAVLI